MFMAVIAKLGDVLGKTPIVAKKRKWFPHRYCMITADHAIGAQVDFGQVNVGLQDPTLEGGVSPHVTASWVLHDGHAPQEVLRFNHLVDKLYEHLFFRSKSSSFLGAKVET